MKKTPSNTQRWNAANAKAARAVSLFDQAAVTLEEAGKEQDDLAAELHLQILSLQVLHKKAQEDAASSYGVADKIRGLLS